MALNLGFITGVPFVLNFIYMLYMLRDMFCFVYFCFIMSHHVLIGELHV